MKTKASVRPTKASAVVNVILGTLFLVFGATLCLAADGEARKFAMMFLVIWVTACGSIIVYGLSILFSKRPPALTEIEMEGMEIDGPSSGGDFAAKLRKLESLRKDGLISEEEYLMKRSQIMMEKW